MDSIKETILQSDRLILGTPVHMGSATGLMMCFLERICWIFAKPERKILTIQGCPATTWIMQLLCLSLFALAMTCNMAIAKTGIPTMQLAAGMHQIEAEIAATPALRHLGLMNRDSLSDNCGMLFVFPEVRTHCMWMQNTLIPLSAAFINEQGVIVNIADMQPNTSDYHCAAVSVRYVLEMRSGWFREKGIAQGTRIEGLDKAPIGR
jgi:uncharacterized protein